MAGRLASLILVTYLAIAQAGRQPASTEHVERGTLPTSWVTGASCPETPPFRIHEYNADLVILRQSGCTNFDYPEGTSRPVRSCGSLRDFTVWPSLRPSEPVRGRFTPYRA